jgi:DNA-binding response OmpR family regulator
MVFEVHDGGSNGQVVRGSVPLRSKETSTSPKSFIARVLLVDDEPSICKCVSSLLSQEGYEVIAAQTGESALAIIRNEIIDVMLVDLRIPDMRGDVVFQVAAVLQPHLERQTLFFTGDISERAEKLIKACNCKFVSKPFANADLVARIRELTPHLHEAAG